MSNPLRNGGNRGSDFFSEQRHCGNQATTSFQTLRLRSPSPTCASVTKRGSRTTHRADPTARRLRLLPGHAPDSSETSGPRRASSGQKTPSPVKPFSYPGSKGSRGFAAGYRASSFKPPFSQAM
jgi:hypothetical protein